MKIKIIFGSLLAVFLLSMLPSISAVEFNSAVEANESRIIEDIQSIDISEISKEIKENGIQSHCFSIILSIIKLFLRVICKTMGFIFGTIGKTIGFIGRIIGFIASLIGFVVGIIGSIFGLVVGTLGTIIGLIFGTLGKIISWIIRLIIPGKQFRSV